MPIRIQPMPVTDNLSVLANPLVAEINRRELVVSGARPEGYTRFLLEETCTGSSRLDAAIAAQRWILQQTGIRALGPLFAWLALLDILGRVDTTPLTTAMVADLATAALALHNVVFMAPPTTAVQLMNASNARQAGLRARHGHPLTPYLPFLHRITERLLPYLPR